MVSVGVWLCVFVEAVWLCVCGSCIGVEFVACVLARNLWVCGQCRWWIGLWGLYGRGDLVDGVVVDWFAGAVWRVCLWKPETLVSSRSKSSMAGVYVVGT